MPVPNLPAFRTAFPELEDIDDATVIASLIAVGAWMQESLWEPADFSLAALYLAAHLATVSDYNVDAFSGSAGGGAVGDSALYMKRVNIGERSVMYAERQKVPRIVGGESAGGVDSNQFNTTSYGRLFLQLRSRNIIPIMVI